MNDGKCISCNYDMWDDDMTGGCSCCYGGPRGDVLSIVCSDYCFNKIEQEISACKGLVLDSKKCIVCDNTRRNPDRTERYWYLTCGNSECIDEIIRIAPLICTKCHANTTEIIGEDCQACRDADWCIQCNDKPVTDYTTWKCEECLSSKGKKDKKGKKKRR